MPCIDNLCVNLLMSVCDIWPNCEFLCSKQLGLCVWAQHRRTYNFESEIWQETRIKFNNRNRKPINTFFFLLSCSLHSFVDSYSRILSTYKLDRPKNSNLYFGVCLTEDNDERKCVRKRHSEKKTTTTNECLKVSEIRFAIENANVEFFGHRSKALNNAMRKIERRAHRKSAVNIHTNMHAHTHTHRRVVASVSHRLPDERYNANSAHPCYNIVCVNERLFDRCVCGKVQTKRNHQNNIKKKEEGERKKEKTKQNAHIFFSLFIFLCFCY